MKLNTKRGLLQLMNCCFIVACHQNLFAQSVHRDTNDNKWLYSLVHLQSVYANNTQPSRKDILYGTAFLIDDHGKLYLVTAKHLVQANLFEKNQQKANDSVFLRYPGYTDEINLKNLSGKNGRKNAVLFTNDEQDIAIISLQKKEYVDISETLLKYFCKPVPIGLIDTGTDHYTNELLAKYGISDYPSPRKINGKFFRFNGSGIVTLRIDQYDPASSFFTIKSPEIGFLTIFPGNDGSAITAHDKLIGMLSHPIGIENNSDIIQSPYYAIHSGKVIKAAYIIHCLRKLQQIEADPGFDK